MINRNNIFIAELKKSDQKLVKFLNDFQSIIESDHKEFSDSFKRLKELRSKYINHPEFIVDFEPNLDDFIPWSGYKNFSLASPKGESELLSFAEIFVNAVNQLPTDLVNFRSLSKERKQEELLTKLPTDEIFKKLESNLNNLSQIFIGNAAELFYQGYRSDLEKFRLSKALAKKDERVKNAETATNEIKKISGVKEDFWPEYEEIRENLEEEIAPFWHKKKGTKNSKNEEKESESTHKKENKKSERAEKKQSCVEKITKKRCFIFKRFNLHLKIWTLRFITYAIPIFLILFHFCEFFMDQNRALRNYPLCSWFVAEVSSNNQNLDNSNQSNSYLYFHLALITTLLIAYQQLRSAISEMNVKKNLIEVYRHRQLVAKNFVNMSSVIDDKDSKTEVIKSAAKSLFENEPSIYHKTNPTPSKAFDLNLVNKS